MSMKTIEITDTNLKGIIEKDGITVLDFWAPWCGPCRMVGPIIDELATNNEDIQVGKVNIGSNKESAARYGIRSIPTIIFFKDGIKVEQVSGAVPLNKLQEIVNGLK
jgi:thioredoxin 1